MGHPDLVPDVSSHRIARPSHVRFVREAESSANPITALQLLVRCQLVTEFGGAASKMSCNRAQQGLQFLGVHAICGHQGANDGIGQHLVNGYFGALWHRTPMILSTCPPEGAKNVSERSRTPIATALASAHE